MGQNVAMLIYFQQKISSTSVAYYYPFTSPLTYLFTLPLTFSFTFPLTTHHTWPYSFIEISDDIHKTVFRRKTEISSASLALPASPPVSATSSISCILNPLHKAFSTDPNFHSDVMLFLMLSRSVG